MPKEYSDRQMAAKPDLEKRSKWDKTAKMNTGHNTDKAGQSNGNHIPKGGNQKPQKK